LDLRSVPITVSATDGRAHAHAETQASTVVRLKNEG
jgi:hypothetical protein